MTVTIASTTDTDKHVAELTESENTETSPQEISAPQADGVPSDEEPSSASSSGDVPLPFDKEETTENAVEAAPSDSEPALEPEPGTDAVAAANSDEAADGEEAVEAETPKRRRRRGRSYKERASQLAREKAIEKQRADSLQAQIEAMNRERQAPPPPQTESPGEADESKEASGEVAQSQSGATGAKAKPDQSDFDSYEEFQEALVEWKVGEQLTVHTERLASIEQESAQKRAHEQAVAAHSERIDAFRADHSDFDAVIDKAKDLPMTRPMQDSVLNSEAGPAIMYHLSRNPEECDRIASMHPLQAIKEIGKIEARLEGAQTGPSSPAEPVTRAPRPIKPVGGGATASTVSIDKLPYQEFKRAREIQLGIRER
jgi:hypothetical protein